MQHKMKKRSIDEYISSFLKDIQAALEKLRLVIKESAPESGETMNYGIVTFKQGGNLVHFAAFKAHIGFYPTPSAIEAFKEELLPYETSKGAIKFPINKPIPFGLIEKIVKFRVNEVSGKDSRMKSSKVTERINAKAFELLEQHPEGLRFSELRSKIEASDSTFHSKTVNGCVWKLPQRFPDKIYKPSKGLFRLLKYKSGDLGNL